MMSRLRLVRDYASKFEYELKLTNKKAAHAEDLLIEFKSEILQELGEELQKLMDKQVIIPCLLDLDMAPLREFAQDLKEFARTLKGGEIPSGT